MKFLDRVLQRWRIAKAKPFVRPGSRVLDLACADGALFRQLGARISEGFGIDPVLTAEAGWGAFRLMPGWFPKDMPPLPPFDVITMLAVLEHIPDNESARVAAGCADRLKPGGYLVITVPSPLVDHVLKVLMFFRLVDGMSLEQHHGFDVRHTERLFNHAGLTLVQHRRFQLGLNNLFVFQKPSVTGPSTA